MNRDTIIIWEVLDPTDAALKPAQNLYESTQAPAERIPWEWIARAPARRRNWRPGQWSPHLLLAASPARTDSEKQPIGFIHGAHVPGYGGYIGYLGVDPLARKLGLGTRLFQEMFTTLTEDAIGQGSELPFCIWESRRPPEHAPQSAWNLWSARMRLFEKVGGFWLDGVTIHAPNYAESNGPRVPLQLFVKPMDRRADEWDTGTSRERVAGLLSQVYGIGPDDPTYAETLSTSQRIRWALPTKADRQVVTV